MTGLKIIALAIGLILCSDAFAGTEEVSKKSKKPDAAQPPKTKEVEGKSYKFVIPENIQFKGHDKVDMYTFKWGALPNTNLVLISNGSAMSSKMLIPSMSNMMEFQLEEQFKKQKLYKKVSKSKRDIKFGRFSGTEIIFDLTSEFGSQIYSYTFVLWDGETIWNVTLTTQNKNDLEITKDILLKMKKNSQKSNTSTEKSMPQKP